MTDADVSAAACAELRRAIAGGASLDELAARYRLPRGIVARHVRGGCDHAVDEPPAPIE